MMASPLSLASISQRKGALEARRIPKFEFVWFTDGMGWHSARHNLEETFDVLDHLYNIDDLNNGAVLKLVSPQTYLAGLLK